MGRIATYRLKAATLVETLVALTLVTIVMTVAWLTVEWVLRGSHQRERIEVELLMNELEEMFYQSPYDLPLAVDTLGYSLSAALIPNEGGTDRYTLIMSCQTPTDRTYQRASLLYLPNLSE